MDPSDPISDQSAQPFLRDRNLKQSVQRLHQLTVASRWGVVLALWLLIGLPSVALFWSSEVSLWVEYFTWAAVRYSLAYNTPFAIALALCIGSTTAVLIWQSRNILFGLPAKEQQRLERQVMHIYRQGHSHPLWNWVVNGKFTGKG